MSYVQIFTSNNLHAAENAIREPVVNSGQEIDEYKEYVEQPMVCGCTVRRRIYGETVPIDYVNGSTHTPHDEEEADDDKHTCQNERQPAEQCAAKNIDGMEVDDPAN
jgi:hypothetical protein